jgi:hypothetical protein
MPIDTTQITTQVLDEELTDNINYLQPSGFRVLIDRTKYPNLEFFAQSVQHPGANLNPVELPVRRITSVPLAGDKMTFTELSFTLLVDEDMKGYQEMYDWMVRIVNDGAVSAGQRGTRKPTYADITLSILSSHNNTTKKIRYLDCMPTNLGGIQFQSTAGDTTFLTFEASFRFSQFEIV